MSKPLRYLRLRGRLGDNGPPFLAELPPGVHRLGSVDDNDIVVRFHGVSRHHLLLRVGDEVTVEDLGSKNGTRINGRSHRLGPLEIGDELFIGPVRLRLEAAQADDVRLATSAGRTRSILEADDLELDGRDTEPASMRQLDRLVESLDRASAEGPLGGQKALDETVAALEAGGACWLVWWERRRCLVTASSGVDFHGLLDLEALCRRAEAQAGSRRVVVLRSSGPPSLVATVLLGRPHPSALLLWDASWDAASGGALARIVTRLLDRECATLEADEAAAGAEPPPAIEWVDGADPASRLLRIAVGRALEQPLPILIEGEAGVGKRHLARWLHAAADLPGPLVSTACAELSDAALAQGFRVAAEQRGTLLLEEIAELPESLYEPVMQIVGTAGAHPRVLMTNRQADLAAVPEALERVLRRQVITLEPLRQRREQMPRLVRHFLRHSQVGQTTSREGAARSITVEAMRRLFAHDWPGNVEELRQRLADLQRRAAGRAIDAAALPETWTAEADEPKPTTSPRGETSTLVESEASPSTAGP